MLRWSFIPATALMGVVLCGDAPAQRQSDTKKISTQVMTGLAYELAHACRDDLEEVFRTEIGKLPNKIALEGHSDSKQYPAGAVYGNWELSAGRANAARRLMQDNGIRQDQVTQVRGFADQRLRKPDSPLDPSNRRISMIVQYLAKTPVPEIHVAADAKDEKGSEAKPNEAKPTKKE